MSFLRYLFLYLSLATSHFSNANIIEDAVDLHNQQITKTTRILNTAGIEGVDLFETVSAEVTNAEPLHYKKDLAESDSIWKRQSLSEGVWRRLEDRSLVTLKSKLSGEIELQDFSGQNLESLPEDRDYGRDNENLFFLDKARSEIYQWNSSSQIWSLDRSQIELPVENLERFFGANGEYYVVTANADYSRNKVWRLGEAPILVDEMAGNIFEVRLINNRVLLLVDGATPSEDPREYRLKFLGEEKTLDRWDPFGKFMMLKGDYWVRSIPIPQYDPFELRKFQVINLKNMKQQEITFPQAFLRIGCSPKLKTVSCTARSDDHVVEFRLVNASWKAIAILNTDELLLPEDYYILFAYGGGIVIRYEQDNRLYYEAVTKSERVILFESDVLEDQNHEEDRLPAITWDGVTVLSDNEVAIGFSASDKSMMLQLKLSEENGLDKSVSLVDYPEYQIESTADQKEMDVNRVGVGSGSMSIFFLLLVGIAILLKERGCNELLLKRNKKAWLD